jgi:hypothetical protein
MKGLRVFVAGIALALAVLGGSHRAYADIGVCNVGCDQIQMSFVFNA